MKTANGTHTNGDSSKMSVNSMYRKRIQRAQMDLQLLLEHAVQASSNKSIDDELICNAAMLVKCDDDVFIDSEKDAKMLWCTIKKLSNVVYPSTVRGLRATDTLSNHNCSVYNVGMRSLVILLIITLCFQGYAIYGIRALGDLDSSLEMLREAYVEIARMEQANPNLRKTTNSSEEKKDDSTKSAPLATRPSAGGENENAHDINGVSENIPINQIRDRARAIEDQIHLEFWNLYRWNAVWAAPLAWFNGEWSDQFWGIELCVQSSDRGNKQKNVAKCNFVYYGENGAPLNINKAGSQLLCDSDHNCVKLSEAAIQILYGSEPMARSMLVFLQTMVLPVLFAILGAWVWLARQRMKEVRERSVIPLLPGEFGQRILLGAVLGCVIGALNATGGLDQYGSLKLIPPIALTFLAGYNVEVVFALLDRIISTITGWFQAKQQPDASPSPPATPQTTS